MTGYIIGGICAAAVTAAGVVSVVRGKNRTKTAPKQKREREIQAGSHIFKADVKDVGELLEVINEKSLNRKDIFLEPEIEADRILFRNGDGLFSAELCGRDAESTGYGQGGAAEDTGRAGSGGLRIYRLSIDRRRATDREAANAAAEAVLTALEKAFLTLDYNAIVEHVYRNHRKTK